MLIRKALQCCVERLCVQAAGIDASTGAVIILDEASAFVSVALPESVVLFAPTPYAVKLCRACASARLICYILPVQPVCCWRVLEADCARLAWSNPVLFSRR